MPILYSDLYFLTSRFFSFRISGDSSPDVMLYMVSFVFVFRFFSIFIFLSFYPFLSSLGCDAIYGI
uniref:Uncharacterized protein n=1 Tax=Arundo donax TaxID=35708 RepID=A0A0A9BLH3_ARUDO